MSTTDDLPHRDALCLAQRNAAALLRRITHPKPEPEPNESAPETAPDQEEQQ